jgi:hypothetical protein
MIIYVLIGILLLPYMRLWPNTGDSENKLNITESLVSILLWPYIIFW